MATGSEINQSPPRRNSKVYFAGIAFDNLRMEDVIDRIDEMVRTGMPRMVVTANVDHLLRIQHDRYYASVVAQADMILADGQPIVWATRLLGSPLKERVPGSDLFPRLCEHAAKQGYRVFFMGGEPGVADDARDVLQRRFPSLQVVGTYCPPMGFEKTDSVNRKAIEAVCSARPHILFVALGSPKQEEWIAAHMHVCRVPVSIGIGISFSFVSGHVKRAPVWMQRVGLEWAHRLYSEPSRLWRRYLIRGPAFIPLVLREIVKSRRRQYAGNSSQQRATDSKGNLPS